MTRGRAASAQRHQPGSLSPDLPWTARDLTALLRLGLLGAAAVATGWIGGSGTVVISRQAGWLGLAVVGNLLAGTAMIGWLLGGLRSVRQLKQQVMAELDERWPTAVTPDAVVLSLTSLVSIQGASRFHRADCRLVQGKATGVASPAQHRKAGRQPCGVCVGGEA